MKMFKKDDEVLVLENEYYDDLRVGTVLRIIKFATITSDSRYFYAEDTKNCRVYFIDVKTIRHLNDIEKILYGQA